MAGNKGYTRRKSRSQAQQEIQWGQRRFDGAQNSDTVASKIGDYDVARSVNTVHTAADIQGHWGRILLSPEATPCSGRLHQVSQHPKTGRWLVHRGNKLWLSTGRDGTGWLEATSLGPDGSLEATGSFADGTATITGAAAAFLSNLVIAGWDGTGPMVINISNEGTDVAGVSLLLDGLTVASNAAIDTTTQPVVGAALAESGGSGISAVLDLDAWTNETATGTVTVPIYEIDFALRGLTLENTDSYDLYPTIVVTMPGSALIRFYKDAAHTELVAEAPFNNTISDTVLVSPYGGSGISGYFEWENADLSVGTYTITALEFEPATVSLDADSTISPYGETGFFVFLRGTAPQNIYIEQDLNQYWLMSTINGYGAEAPSGGASGDYKYRYLSTYSRIVDPFTKEPAYAEDRISAFLQFEGPSSSGEPGGLDYNQLESSGPIDSGNPLSLEFGVASSRAASYITHLSIYRTLDVGIHGIGIEGEGNYSEIYIWVMDVPIYQAAATDETSDDILRNRFVGASTEQENMSLRSRLWREMSRGIGAIGPDFMVTAEPQAQVASYCDIAFNPRLIGFHFPGEQRFILQDPISEIYRTKDLFVFLCPSSTYTSVSAVNAETGIPGLIPILTIQNFDPASRTIGIKYGQGVFPVDESSFITLCTDGTVRIFSADRWSDPIESTRLHGITSQLGVGAVFSFFRGVMLLWGRTAGATTMSGPGSAVLSDLVLSGWNGDFLYGRVEPQGGGDAYSVIFYSDEDYTVEVARGESGVTPTLPQTVTITATGDSGVSGSVYAYPFGTTLPKDFTVDFRQIADTCLRYAQGGANGINWTEISRPYWAYPALWCGAMLVEDDNSALRVAVFDAYDGAVFAVEDALPLRQFEDDVVTVTAAAVAGDITEYISALTLTGAAPGVDYDVVISGITPDIFGVYIVDGMTTLAQYEGPVAGQPLTNAVLTEVGGSGISGIFSIHDFVGGYVYGTVTAGGAVVSAAADIPSLIRLRELTGAQENYKSSHEESHVAVRPRYDQTALPSGLELTVRGYVNGVLAPGAETVVPPSNSDIQFFAPVEGDRIQIEYETNKSGWRISSFDTRYQTQDMQAPDGPWNGQEDGYQTALGDGLVSWLYGSSGLVDRASASNASYPGTVPDEIDGPSDTFYGQNFTAAVERALAATLQDYTLMLWVLGPAIGLRAVQVSEGLYVAFPIAGYIDVGGMGSNVSPEVFTGNGWQHFAITRKDLVRTIYQNGVAIASEEVDGAEVDAAVMVVGADGETMPLCDVRLYDNALDAAVLAYYYNDVANNEGRKVLP